MDSGRGAHTALKSRGKCVTHVCDLCVSCIYPGVAYCLMLTVGSFALAENKAFGVGAMEVGTFYALCKIYLSTLDCELHCHPCELNASH